MASTYSDRLKLELMQTGANAATWGTNTNNNLEVLDAYNNGYVSIDVTGNTNVALTASDASPLSQASNKVLEITGSLSAAVTVLIPARESNYLVYNNTSGSYALTVGNNDEAGSALGNTATIIQGSYGWVYSDGTNTVLSNLNSNASQITAGTVADARLSANVTLNNASTISTGTLADAHLSANVTLNNASTISTGTLPNARLSAVPNSALENSSITINGTDTSLGGSITVGDILGVTAGDGLTGGGTTGTVELNVGAGTGIDVTTNAIAVDVSDFMSNGSNNRVLTATGADAMNAEANLTFDGSILYASGNVGFGIASPTGEAGERILHLHNSAADSVALHMTNSNSGSADGDGFTIRMLANEDVRFVNDDLNNFEWWGQRGKLMLLGDDSFLQVGSTTVPSSTVFGFCLYTSGGGYTSGHWLRQSRDVTGSGTVCQHYGSAGSIRFMGDGDAENTNNSYGAISDRKLKENETAARSQWEDIKALQIKNYNLKEHPDRTHIGVVAQDLEEAGMTGLVKDTTDYDDEGNDLGTVTKTVKYSVLYMKAVKALQEALTRIETLETEVNTLKNQ